MAKIRDVAQQTELFPHNPEIIGLGISEFKLEGAFITGKIMAVTEAIDAAMLTPERWAQAAAMWAVKLLNGDWYLISEAFEAAYTRYCEEKKAREADEAIGYAETGMPTADAPRETGVGVDGYEIKEAA